MGILEAVIRALIYIACIFLAYYLIGWFLGMLGIAVPAMVMKVIMVILILIAILVLVRLLVPPLRGMTWWP